MTRSIGKRQARGGVSPLESASVPICSRASPSLDETSAVAPSTQVVGRAGSLLCVAGLGLALRRGI